MKHQKAKDFARITPPLAALFFLVCFDATNIFERPLAAIQAASTDPSCMALIDPAIVGDPTAPTYFQTHPISITKIDEMTMRRCFKPANSVNPFGTNAIVLNQDRVTTPAAIAVAISHELVHIMHSDRTTDLGQHSFIRHLWMTEEGEAHLKGLHTARALNVPLMYPAWAD